MKNAFYQLAIAIFLIALPVLSLAQSNLLDVVYLKNGSIIKGIIVEQVPGQAIKLQTADGSLFVFESSEITKMTREAATSNSVASTTQPSSVTSAPANSKPKDRDEWGRTYTQNMDIATSKKNTSIGLLSTGSVLVAGGTALLVYGIINTHQQAYPLIGGGAAVLVGIPFLAVGGALWSAQVKYRNRAKNMDAGTASLSPTLIGTQRFSGGNVQSGAAIGLQFAIRF